jgi:hypothetical protein
MGSQQPGVSFGSVVRVADQNTSALLSGFRWTFTGAAQLTFSFPAEAAFYGTDYPDDAPSKGFEPVNPAQQTDIRRALGLIASYTGLTFQFVTESATVHATLRFANSLVPETAYAFYPSADQTAGDSFFGMSGTGLDPVIGNFDSGLAVLHEIGHALGLKHGHETDVYGALTADRNDALSARGRATMSLPGPARTMSRRAAVLPKSSKTPP